jgi:hypothetical protein
MNLRSYAGGVVLATVCAPFRSLGGTPTWVYGVVVRRKDAVFTAQKQRALGSHLCRRDRQTFVHSRRHRYRVPMVSPAHKLACLIIVPRIKPHSRVGSASVSPPIL